MRIVESEIETVGYLLNKTYYYLKHYVSDSYPQ